jgi:hypothetical protein
VFSEVQTAPGLDVISRVVPSGNVASADSCADCVRTTTQGDGEIEMEDTAFDEVLDPPQPAPLTVAMAAANRPKKEFIE